MTQRHLLTALFLALLFHAGVALWLMTFTETPKTNIKPAPPTVTITLAHATKPFNTPEPSVKTPPVKQEITPPIKTTDKVPAKASPVLKAATKPLVKPASKPTLKPDIKPIDKPKTTPKPTPKTTTTSEPKLNSQKILPPPMPEAKSTPATQAPSPPANSFTNKEAKQYQQQLSAWLNQYKVYPKRAKRMRIEGEGILRIQIDRTGVVQTIKLTQSTGNRLLDKAALKTAQNASPFPAMSLNDPRQSMVFEVPIVFLLR
ncbi:MAG: TonB family protein [Thiomicrorhabdus sp.]|nr:TonB family protein [Thiomicrorhabdus sp.]